MLPKMKLWKLLLSDWKERLKKIQAYGFGRTEDGNIKGPQKVHLTQVIDAQSSRFFSYFCG
jgi:hypothetical protein